MTSRPSFKLFACLYPFGAGAAAVNVFFAALIGSWLGWEVLTPQISVLIGAFLGVPVTWVFACHIKKLMEQADSK
ncbi:NnrT protein [Pseudophaeobacter flagellatus]|uniref:NnrT protein n=1 Tax=Pseudophaeobacter flagellatus TaxID=2899119 RepID=UPI001E2E3F38|nr:NnrT protein [Pseudophaeobacter flagellatus]MCD9146615.1 NnrT protein [Pseudophaeobacter flagellatus]